MKECYSCLLDGFFSVRSDSVLHGQRKLSLWQSNCFSVVADSSRRRRRNGIDIEGDRRNALKTRTTSPQIESHQTCLRRYISPAADNQRYQEEALPVKSQHRVINQRPHELPIQETIAEKFRRFKKIESRKIISTRLHYEWPTLGERWWGNICLAVFGKLCCVVEKF